MRVRLKPWAFLVLLAIVIAAAVFGLYSYGHRFVRSDADLVALLPSGDVTTFYANVADLRRAGLLNLVAGSKATEDADYRNFVRQTGFDYTHDLDTIAGAASGDRILLLVRGRFDWDRLREYTTAQGGQCDGGTCRMPTSKPGRWLSFRPIQSDVMVLALSPDPFAAVVLLSKTRRAPEPLPPQPVWVHVAPSLLKNPVALPVPLRIFAISLQSADSVVLSLAAAAENSGAAFNLRLEAQCPSPATAETIRSQMELQTKMLELELEREHQQPNAGDLSGLLTSGRFQVQKDRVIGTWPVRNELLKTLE